MTYQQVNLKKLLPLEQSSSSRGDGARKAAAATAALSDITNARDDAAGRRSGGVGAASGASPPKLSKRLKPRSPPSSMKPRVSQKCFGDDDVIVDSRQCRALNHAERTNLMNILFDEEAHGVRCTHILQIMRRLAGSPMSDEEWREWVLSSPVFPEMWARGTIEKLFTDDATRWNVQTHDESDELDMLEMVLEALHRKGLHEKNAYKEYEALPSRAKSLRQVVQPYVYIPSPAPDSDTPAYIYVGMTSNRLGRFKSHAQHLFKSETPEDIQRGHAKFRSDANWAPYDVNGDPQSSHGERITRMDYLTRVIENERMKIYCPAKVTKEVIVDTAVSYLDALQRVGVRVSADKVCRAVHMALAFLEVTGTCVYRSLDCSDKSSTNVNVLDRFKGLNFSQPGLPYSAQVSFRDDVDKILHWYEGYMRNNGTELPKNNDASAMKKAANAAFSEVGRAAMNTQPPEKTALSRETRLPIRTEHHRRTGVAVSGTLLSSNFLDIVITSKKTQTNMACDQLLSLKVSVKGEHIPTQRIKVNGFGQMDALEAFYKRDVVQAAARRTGFRIDQHVPMRPEPANVGRGYKRSITVQFASAAEKISLVPKKYGAGKVAKHATLRVNDEFTDFVLECERVGLFEIHVTFTTSAQRHQRKQA